MLKMICRKMDIHTAKCYREYLANGTFHYRNEVKLARLGHKTMKLDYRNPTPYEPGGKNPNESDMEMEVDAAIGNDYKRRGSWDLKLDQIVRNRKRITFPNLLKFVMLSFRRSPHGRDHFKKISHARA
jgi:hypothetical protein